MTGTEAAVADDSLSGLLALLEVAPGLARRHDYRLWVVLGAKEKVERMWRRGEIGEESITSQ